MHAQGIPNAEIARRLGITRQTVHGWVKESGESPRPVSEAQVMAMVQAAAQAESAKVVPIRPDLTITPPEVVPTVDDLRALALESLRVGIQSGDLQASMWALERIDPETFGTPRDRKAMAELREKAAAVAPSRVVVTIGTPKKRATA